VSANLLGSIGHGLGLPLLGHVMITQDHTNVLGLQICTFYRGEKKSVKFFIISETKRVAVIITPVTQCAAVILTLVTQCAAVRTTN
jgi:hypothetical protein